MYGRHLRLKGTTYVKLYKKEWRRNSLRIIKYKHRHNKMSENDIKKYTKKDKSHSVSLSFCFLNSETNI